MSFINKFRIVIVLISAIFLFTKTNSIAQYSDSLKLYSNKLLHTTNYKQRKEISSQIIHCINKAADDLSIEKVDSLNVISVLKSDDKKLTIFSWEIMNDSNSFDYYCLAIIKKQNIFYVQSFIDKTHELKNYEYVATSPNKWYGAHYYQLIQKKNLKKTYYTLIGIDWKSILSKKKLIEVWSIDANGNIVCGEPIIQVNNRQQRRIILEYKYDISISCRYNFSTKMIVFDHLIPPNAALKNQRQFYVNDLSFDALKFLKGKWIFFEDIDARNDKSKQDETYSEPK